MAKINTLNYQPLSVWDGDDDLFIVQQVDNTKVATPNQIRDYVLAGGAVLINKLFAECSTARNVAAKTVTLPGFELKTGTRITVRFTDTGASNPSSGNITLNVNGTGAKEIVDSHTNMTKLTYDVNMFYNNMTWDFIYDGTYWVYLNRDNNTTYTSKAASSGGTATSLCTTGEKYTWNNKQNALTFDNSPTQNSNNPVKSGGIYTALIDKADKQVFTVSSVSGNQTLTGESYVKIFDSLPAGKYLIIANYYGTVNCLICPNNTTLGNNFGDIGVTGGVVYADSNVARNIYLYINTSDTNSYTFYRCKFTAVKLA